MKLTSLLSGITILHSFKFSRDEEAKKAGISKQVNATFSFEGMTLEQALDKAVRQAAISWQHSNRPDYDKFDDGHPVVIMVQSAGRKQVDHEAATAAKFAGANVEQQREILRKVVGDTLTDEQLDELLKSGTPVDVTDR